jgi:hypothetical protein
MQEPRLPSRAPGRGASCSGRPRAQASRPSLTSGSSGEDGPGGHQPPARRLASARRPGVAR